MNTLPLVAPEARALAAQFPVFAPGRESLAQYRPRINAMYASGQTLLHLGQRVDGAGTRQLPLASTCPR